MSDSEIEQQRGDSRRSERRHYIPAVVGSLLLHIVIFGLLFFGITFNFHKETAQPAKIIDAVVVRSTELEAPVKKVLPKPEMVDPQEEERKATLAKQKQQEALRQEEQVKQEAERKKQETQKHQETLRQEQLRREAEQKKKEEEKRGEEKRQEQLKQEAERKKQETERKQQEEKKRQEEQKKQEEMAERKRLQEQQQTEERQLEAARAKEKLTSEMAILRARYQQAIFEKITRNWIRPVSSQAGNRCEVSISQIPGGEVINISVRSCTGDSIFQRSVENAVHKISPLPYEGFEKVFEREIRLIFMPQE